MQNFLKYIITLITLLSSTFFSAGSVDAAGYGVHLLRPEELPLVLPYRGTNHDFYVTVPYSVYDRRGLIWNTFFKLADQNNITPLVRLVTQFENNSWQQPTRKDIVEATDFLSSLDWPGKMHIILFNEPNHAAEWGGQIDPAGYAKTALFAARWLKTESKEYVVLPAGLDAAAPNGVETMDSFAFIKKMVNAEPELLSFIDGWTSHSYANPGFVGSAYSSGKQSIKGFESELNLLSQYGKENLPVYITETGWRQTESITPRLSQYYQYAADNVWNHDQVKAVTVFVLQASNGPFTEFSLLHPNGSPTPQLHALRRVLE
jgi:hypothetical protein